MKHESQSPRPVGEYRDHGTQPEDMPTSNNTLSPITYKIANQTAEAHSMSDDIEQFSGPMFNKRGDAIEPSQVVTDSAYVGQFMEASERLARKVLHCA